MSHLTAKQTDTGGRLSCILPYPVQRCMEVASELSASECDAILEGFESFRALAQQVMEEAKGRRDEEERTRLEATNERPQAPSEEASG